MLSKAAFNALLKILEEPPASVLFILATTDEQKILETVQSRCFKLFFTPVKQSIIVDHLVHICDQEKISYQRTALELIAQECNGSVRDAMNLLEQMRFSSSTITPETVMHLLGRIDDNSLLHILELIFRGNTQLLLKKLHEIHWYDYKADVLWYRLLVTLRALIWSKYGFSSPEMKLHASSIGMVAQQVSLPFLYNTMNTLHTYEQLFLRTTSQHSLLEIILLQLCHKKGDHEGESGAMLSSPAVNPVESNQKAADSSSDEETRGHYEPAPALTHEDQALWSRFMHAVSRLDEQLLLSIMKQTELVTFDSTTHSIKAQCAQGGVFFKGIVDETQALWQPVLRDIFGTQATLHIDFGPVRYITPAITSTTAAILPQTQQPLSAPERRPLNNKSYQGGISRQRSTQAPYLKQPLSVNDQGWPISTKLLQHFPGTIYTTHEYR